MKGSIYINNISSDEAGIDTSYSPGVIMQRGTTIGFAYLKTLEHLGIEYRVNKLEGHLIVRGSINRTRKHLQKLHRNIEIISQYAAEINNGPGTGLSREWDRQEIQKILKTLVKKVIPALPEETSVGELVGIITQHFAGLINSDGIDIYYDSLAPWRQYLDEHIVIKGKQPRNLQRSARLLSVPSRVRHA